LIDHLSLAGHPLVDFLIRCVLPAPSVPAVLIEEERVRFTNFPEQILELAHAEN
jgi:hypothetical protein